MTRVRLVIVCASATVLIASAILFAQVYVASGAIGDLLVATGPSSFGRIVSVATGQVLTSGGVNASPAYSATPTLTRLTLSNPGAETLLNVAGDAAQQSTVYLGTSQTNAIYRVAGSNVVRLYVNGVDRVTFDSSGAVLATTATGGLGYGAGAGGTVTQATSKSTGVTLNTVTGEITMNAAALAANTTVSFTLTDSAIAAADYVLVQHFSAGTGGAYACTAQSAAGSATVNVRNITAVSLSEAIVLKFVVVKAVTS